MLLRSLRGQVLEDGQNLGRRGVLRREAVAAANDHRLELLAVEHGLHVEVERLALGSRLLRAVEHADSFDARGQHVEEIFLREGTVEVYGHQTHLATLLRQVVDRLLDGLRHRAHGHDDVFGLGMAVIDEGFVVAARDLRDLAHGVGHHVGHGVVELVGRLARLEIDVGVLRRTARDGVLGVERPGTEGLQRIAVEQRRERRLVDQLDLLNLVRGAESVEEVQERHAGLQRHEVRDARQVHHLLHGRGGQHGEARLPGGHHVLMVAEDRQRLRGQRAGRNVEDARQQLARNLVHIGDHQQQTLRRGERRGQGAALQRTVHGARGARLRLHLDDLHGLAEDIPAPLRGPLVHEFGHRR